MECGSLSAGHYKWSLGAHMWPEDRRVSEEENSNMVITFLPQELDDVLAHMKSE